MAGPHHLQKLDVASAWFFKFWCSHCIVWRLEKFLHSLVDNVLVCSYSICSKSKTSISSLKVHNPRSFRTETVNNTILFHFLESCSLEHSEDFSVLNNILHYYLCAGQPVVSTVLTDDPSLRDIWYCFLVIIRFSGLAVIRWIVINFNLILSCVIGR